MKKLNVKPTRPKEHEYKIEYCKLLIEHMAKGLSFDSFGATLTPRICRDVLYHWLKQHETFLEARNIGIDASLLDYEKTGLDLQRGEIQGSATAHVWIGKNRHGWRDKQEIEQTVTTKTETIEEYIERTTKDADRKPE